MGWSALPQGGVVPGGAALSEGRDPILLAPKNQALMRHHIENLEAVRVPLYPDPKHRESGGWGGVQASVGSMGPLGQPRILKAAP